MAPDLAEAAKLAHLGAVFLGAMAAHLARNPRRIFAEDSFKERR